MRIIKYNSDYIDDVVEIASKELKGECWTKKMFLDSFDKSNTFMFLCIDKNKLVGFVNYLITSDDVNILNIAIKEEYQMQGIGTKLIQRVVNIAKRLQVSKLSLEVSADNYIAQKFYKSCGFKQIGIRKKYYNNGADAIVMFLELV